MLVIMFCIWEAGVSFIHSFIQALHGFPQHLQATCSQQCLSTTTLAPKIKHPEKMTVKRVILWKWLVGADKYGQTGSNWLRIKKGLT